LAIGFLLSRCHRRSRHDRRHAARAAHQRINSQNRAKPFFLCFSIGLMHIKHRQWSGFFHFTNVCMEALFARIFPRWANFVDRTA
jgi:hypothetical protein